MINLRIETLLVRAFRGVEDLTIGFSELATIVGENATGKSTIGLAINRALLQAETNHSRGLSIWGPWSDGNQADPEFID